MEQGILGIKKDPKKRVLLFVNGEEWPSEDTDDSDFAPKREIGTIIVSKTAGKVKKKKKKSKSSDVDGESLGGFKKAKKKKKSKKKKYKIPVDLPPIPIETIDTLQDQIQKPKKKKIKSEDKETKKYKRKPKEPECPEDCAVGPWGTVIPPEALLRIFQFVVEMEGNAFPFLNRAAKVCSLWKRTTGHPSLWQQVDLSTVNKRLEDKLLWLCKNRLSQVRELNLGGWVNTLTRKGVKAICDSCSQLTSINLSGCKKLTSKDIALLVDNCPRLSIIDLSQTSHNGSSDSPVTTNSLKYLMNKCGKHLTQISLANNTITGVSAIINIIGDCCPNLAVLDLSNVQSFCRDVIQTNIEKLQAGCPRLRVLRLANTLFRLANVPLTEQASSSGFPELEELSIAVQSGSYFSGIDDSGLERILKSSEKLRLLDVRGCSRISNSGLVRIPAWEIEHLFLCQCPAAMGPELELVIQKWQHSLREVDLSWNNHTDVAVDSAVNALANDQEQSKLETLDLCGSAVTLEPVKRVLNNCPRLSTLNLASCRGLPRGMKRLYKYGELEKLKEDIFAAKFGSLDGET